MYIYIFLQARCKLGWSCDQPGFHVEPSVTVVVYDNGLFTLFFYIFLLFSLWFGIWILFFFFNLRGWGFRFGCLDLMLLTCAWFGFWFQMYVDFVNQKFEWVWWIWFEISLDLLFVLLLWYEFFFNKSVLYVLWWL